jgi:MFS family permease
MAAVRFLQVACVGVAITFFNVYLDSDLGVATAQIGIIAASARLFAVPMALLGPSLSRRLGFGETAVLASTFAGLSMLPLAFGNVAVAGVGFIGVMSFTSMRYPAFYVYMMERTPERLRSIMNGANEMAAGLSFAAVSLIAGYVIVRSGYPAAFLMGGAITLFGTAIFAVYVRWGADLNARWHRPPKS